MNIAELFQNLCKENGGIKVFFASSFHERLFLAEE